MGYSIVLRILITIAPYVSLLVISLYAISLKTNNVELKERLDYTQAHLILQNESIEKLELESQKYKILQPREKEKIKERYKQVIIKDNTCEAKLESYEDLINAFKKITLKIFSLFWFNVRKDLRLSMRLYSKIQEFLNTIQTIESSNAQAIEIAKNKLSDFVKEKTNQRLNEIKNELNDSVSSELLKLQKQVKTNVKELVNQNELTREIHADLLNQFNKQEIKNELKRELKFEIKKELEYLLQTTELQNEIKSAQSSILIDTIASTEQDLKVEILGVLKRNLDKITESVVKNLDFSFLRTQPRLFYSAINENLKEMFLNELKSEYLQKYINSVIESYFKQAERLKLLRETELKALCYLQVVLESNKVKMLQDALMLENQNIQNELKIQNEIAHNEKRKQLIADGKLEDESFKQFKFKVI